MAPRKTLYGGETKKAVDNFPISGETVPASVIHWLGRIKGAAARANADLGKLDPKLADAIARAGDEVAAGDHDAQFPIDVFQTGSGTSSNMNANEVLAALAGDGVHANDHVNMGQSSNDVFPSAVHLAALDRATNQLLPALKQLERSLARKAKRFQNVVKSGRTHLMDAVPVTLGQEFGGYAAQVRLGQERIEAALVHVRQIPLGGTATGTGLNTHPKFAEKVRRELTRQTKLKIDPPADPFEAQANRDALVELSGALKVVAVSLTKIAQDIALMGSGPRAGIGEIFLPELQKGSSIMPGKVNPVMPEVVLQVGRAGHRQRRRDHRRRPAGPVRAQRAHPAHRAQPAAVDPPALDRVGSPSPRSASTASRSTRRAPSARPSRRSPWPPRSTSTSATTRARRSSRRRRSPGARCATSRSRRASSRRSTTASSTCARSRRGIRPRPRGSRPSALRCGAARRLNSITEGKRRPAGGSRRGSSSSGACALGCNRACFATVSGDARGVRRSYPS